jgi:fructokinase
MNAAPAPPPQPWPTFVAAGEALTDLIIEEPDAASPGSDRADGQRWRAQPGGAGWNVARAPARLGLASAFAGAIGHDVFGQALWDRSAAAGLDMRFIQRMHKSPLLAVVHQTHPPRYFFIGDDSADLHFDPQQLPGGWAEHVQWVHFGGISLAREPLAGRLLALARALKARGVRICFDPNHRSVMDSNPHYPATLRAMTELADVVKVSDDDLSGLFGSVDIAAPLATLRSWNPQALCLVSLGARGATLHAGLQHWTALPPPVTVADTVGAGDACIAGLLSSLMQRPEMPPAEHLRFAVAAGSAACQQAGASPPGPADIQALLHHTLLA